MGYRHYVGYIPKQNIQEVLEHVKHLKSLIGTPRPSLDGFIVDEDDRYTDYDITEYLQDAASSLVELGKLYYSNTDPITKVLYDSKGDDYSNDDTEFFFVNDPDHRFLYKLSVASMECWTSFLTKAKASIDSCITTKTPLSIDQCADLLEVSELFKQEIRSQEFASKCIADSKQHPFPPFFQYQFNYEAAKIYYIHENFDYENNILCVFAY